MEVFGIRHETEENGAGVYCDSSGLTLTGRTVSHKDAFERGAGGIYGVNATLTLVDCKISDNAETEGDAREAALSNCTFAGARTVSAPVAIGIQDRIPPMTTLTSA